MNYECYKKLWLTAVMAAAVTTWLASNGSGGYNVGGYIMEAFSALHKQLCWEFGVSHNCVCIMSEGLLINVVTCYKNFL